MVAASVERSFNKKNIIKETNLGLYAVPFILFAQTAPLFLF